MTYSIHKGLSSFSPILPVKARAARKAVAVGAMAAILAGSASIASAGTAPGSFADLVDEVSPAVVNIATTSEAKSGPENGNSGRGLPRSPFPKGHPFNDFFEKFGVPNQPEGQAAPDRPEPPGRKVSGAGSGFIVDADGYVVTNSHVVNGAAKISITLRNGKSFDAKLIGEDPTTDLALLKIDSDTPLPFVRFGDSDKIRVGDWVLTVGNPFGLNGSVTAGIVSARGRDLPGGNLIDFLQVDAPINPGNSGGPAFNADSKVIGVNTAIFSPNGGNIGIGFAIPSNIAANVIADLRDDGKVDRSWLGVRVQGVTEDIAKGFGLEKASGALVAAVEDGSPAAEAGLKRGDIILEWNGAAIESMNDLPRAVAFTPAGEKLKVKIWRAESFETVSVTTAAKPDQELLASNDRQQPASTERKLDDTGITLVDLTPELRERFSLGNEARGVLIADVDPGSEAAEKGLRPGDVIVSVGLDTVASTEELISQIDVLHNEKATVVTLGMLRDKSESFVALRLTTT